MKKTLVAVASVVAVTSAFADVSISGNLNESVLTDKLGGANQSARTALHPGSNDSFITFNGSEDLGNGLKAGFKIEQALDLNNFNNTTIMGPNSAGNSNRETSVNLSGSWGFFGLGNQYQPVFFSAIGGDPMGANNLTGNMGLRGLAGVTSNNSLLYTTPTFSGVQASFIDAYGGSDTKVANSGNGYGYSLSYTNGGLGMGFGQQQSKNSGAIGANLATLGDIGKGQLVGAGAAITDPRVANGAVRNAAVADGDKLVASAWHIGYDFGMAKVSYYTSKYTVATNSVNGKALGISAPVGGFTLGASYGDGSNQGSTKADYTGYQYSARYALSKRTYAYVEGGKIEDTTNHSTRTQSAVGINHSF